MTIPMSDVAKLIDELRELRLKIARQRVSELTVRYPEMEVAGVEPLDDGTLVQLALERELAHQTRVAGDLGLPTSVERGR